MDARAVRPLSPPPGWDGPVGPGGRALPDVKEMLPEELAAFMAAWGEPAYRGRQLFGALHGRGVRSFGEIHTLPAALRTRLERETTLHAARLLERQVDRGDGTVKYLLALGDGETVEAVLMRYHYGYSACISSQVGCRMGCRFCASTLGGLRRNLRASEMAEQVALLNFDLAAHASDPEAFPVPAGEAPGGHDRISRLVVMGMGEPLENLDAVVRFLRVVHAPEGAGIGWRHLTVSTSGLVDGMDRLTELALPLTLAVSLHAPNDALRDRLVPLNRRFPLHTLLPACQRYAERTGRRLTFEYILIDRVNDLPEHARELGRLLRGLSCHVNLIPMNPVPERALFASPPEAVARFRGLLRGAGLAVTVRRQLGAGIAAACGQLRRQRDGTAVGAALEPPGQEA